MLAGCGSAEKMAQTQETEAARETNQTRETEAAQETNQTQEAESGTEMTQEPAAKPEESTAQEFSFADVADREFYFSSGAGGWRTVLYIYEDGSFDGNYMDSDMGVTGESYPNGTIHYSEFSGQFTEPQKVDDGIWKFQIGSIEYPYGFGEEIKDGYHYYYTDAYGLEEAEDLYLYLPGIPVAELPGEYQRWIGYYDPDAVSQEELPFYGLYNVKQQEGFSSYSYEKPEPAEQIAEYVSQAEEQAAALEETLKAAVAQTDMNIISMDIYTVWDDCLNSIWRILKENLSEEAMAALTAEERNWIAEKEKAVKEAGAGAEGGSIYPLVVNQKAVELTKERVYALAGYLSENN